jgi:serine/threonine protein kinase
MGKSYDGTKSDIWSAGIVLYILATGKVPWTATNRKHLYQQVSNAQFSVPVSLDVDITTAITSCLKPNPASRPSAYELLFFPLVKPLSGEVLAPAMRSRQRKLTSVGQGPNLALHQTLFKQSAARSMAYIRQLKTDPISQGDIRTLPTIDAPVKSKFSGSSRGILNF